jgi:hypothetical protein
MPARASNCGGGGLGEVIVVNETSGGFSPLMLPTCPLELVAAARPSTRPAVSDGAGAGHISPESLKRNSVV